MCNIQTLAAARTTEEPGQMDKEQLLALLSSTRKKLADQGRIVDARLLEKEKQIIKLLEELEK